MHSITLQHDGIRIASTSLDMNVLSVADIFQTISETSKKELERQALLLAGVDADLDIINRVNIHVDFMSTSVRKTIENGERHRTLGDYVSNQKMKQVAEVCSKTHGTPDTLYKYMYIDAERCPQTIYIPELTSLSALSLLCNMGQIMFGSLLMI